jgi:hypothetical protein
MTVRVPLWYAYHRLKNTALDSSSDSKVGYSRFQTEAQLGFPSCLGGLIRARLARKTSPVQSAKLLCYGL